MYLIQNYCPTLHEIGRHGFCIALHPALKLHVASSGLTQDDVHRYLEAQGRSWLDCCGFDGIFDPDNCGFEADPSLPPGPRAGPMYPPHCLRVHWGEWGPEHLSVPGDACSLNIDLRGMCNPLAQRGNASPVLRPHNIDSWMQKSLLLIVFSSLIESVMLFSKWEGS